MSQPLKEATISPEDAQALQDEQDMLDELEVESDARSEALGYAVAVAAPGEAPTVTLARADAFLAWLVIGDDAGA